MKINNLPNTQIIEECHRRLLVVTPMTMTFFDQFILDEERSWKITDCCLEIKDASHICT